MSIRTEGHMHLQLGSDGLTVDVGPHPEVDWVDLLGPEGPFRHEARRRLALPREWA